ncbi:MAG: hypothetical protein K6E30_07545 [Lachnospiraceae bacterium]|nr:hypothetical protein [Lachnospiraceae bacterium]
MSKNVWKNPIVAVEAFVPNEYCSTCTLTMNGLKLWAPFKESNGVAGWQQYNHPAGLDQEAHNEDGYVYVYDPYRLINQNTKAGKAIYPEDNAQCYWEFTLTKPATDENGNEIIPVGTILYKNYEQGGLPEFSKNHS